MKARGPELAPGAPPRSGPAVELAGWALLAGGAVLMIAPGPGIPLVLAGLVLLGRRRRWARRLHVKLSDGARQALDRVRRPASGRPGGRG